MIYNSRTSRAERRRGWEGTDPVREIHLRQAAAILCLTLFLLVSAPPKSALAVFQARTLRSSDYSGLGMPMTDQELQALVAPIALYPDPLLAQMLAGSTYPDQLVLATEFVQQSKVQGHSLMEVVAKQNWDPSIKALTEFPTVLNNMSHNLAWTSLLGDRYHNQQTEVMAAIQAMRAKAFASGALKNGTRLRVNQPTPDIIAIQPSNPQLVYIPLYNSTTIYGTQVQTPFYTPTETAQGNDITFNVGVSVGALTAGGCCEWGSINWDTNWYRGVVNFKNTAFFGNDSWHGGHYGGYNYYGNHQYRTSYDFAHPYTAFGRGGRAGTAIVNATIEEGSAKAPDPIEVASGGWMTPDETRGWGQADTGASPTAFSSWGDRSLPVAFGTVGWGDRSSSYRGWTSHGGGTGGWGHGGIIAQNH